MPEIREPLYNKTQTIKKIYWIADKFKGDLDECWIKISGRRVPLSDLTFFEYFDFVRQIPYRRDAEPVELLARPRVIIERYAEGIGKDCKKSAVLFGAWFEKNGIPWRLVTVSTRPDKRIHHIFNQADLSGNGVFLNVDATYSNMKPFQEKTVTKAEYY